MNGVKMFVRPSWMSRGACLDSGVNFFPHPGESAAAARAVCAICPVQQDCLDFALDGADVGVWGGYTEKERDRILRDRILRDRRNAPRRTWQPKQLIEATA